MYLIKSCPSCGIKLRFPINQGTIRVTCSCGNVFIADPDNSSLYRDAVFDIKKNRRHAKNSTGEFLRAIKRRFHTVQLRVLIPRIINLLYDLKYNIQNFKLLPGTEKRRVILILLLGTIALVALLYVIFHSPKSGTAEKMII